VAEQRVVITRTACRRQRKSGISACSGVLVGVVVTAGGTPERYYCGSCKLRFSIEEYDALVRASQRKPTRGTPSAEVQVEMFS
jgi:hypothetical protein